MTKPGHKFGGYTWRRSLRLLLAVYLTTFTCALPALHTCEPHITFSASGAPTSSFDAPADHHHATHGDDDLCFVCRVVGDSGGVLPPIVGEAVELALCLERAAPVSCLVLSHHALRSCFPRAPPA